MITRSRMGGAWSGWVESVALAMVLLTAVIGCASAQSGTFDAVCKSVSVLDELDQKDPANVRRILADAGKVPNSHAMLWRIEREGLPSSHLFGTVHVVDQTLMALSPAVRDAIARSKVVALEAAELSRSAIQQTMTQAGKLMTATDQPLPRLLDDEEMKTVEKAFSDAGYPVNLALGVRPWVAGLFLSSSQCQIEGLAAGLKPLDLLVSDAAKAASIQLVGLEDLFEQYEALASIPDDVQGAWLRASIEMHDRVDDVTHTMVELYRFRRLSAVWELTREMAPRAKLTQDVIREIQNGLVVRRNPRMLERSLPLIEAGGAFIAVGAMHLSGSDGLVAMLETKGYTLTAIE